MYVPIFIVYFSYRTCLDVTSWRDCNTRCNTSRPDSDLDYLNFMCTHELILIDTLAEQIELPVNTINALRKMCNLVRHQVENEHHIPSVSSIEIQAVPGAKG